MKVEKKVTVQIVSSLAKVFADEITGSYMTKLTALGGERVSFQLALRLEARLSQYARVELEGSLPMTFREVKFVPVAYPCRSWQSDEDYIRKTAGLYPDLLEEAEGGVIRLAEGQWRSIWVDIRVPKGCVAGDYPLCVKLWDMDGTKLAEEELVLTVVGADLPPQTLKRTEWFYGDCLADYYGVEVFSERHWQMMEAFIRRAAESGCTMILSPIFTPPLDTEVGHERSTIQLVEVERKEGEYRFDFEKLERWVRMCENCGIHFFEMAHLFTQWGAAAAPKIMATVEGKKKQVFGWDTPADGAEYRDFLKAFLPKLCEVLLALGLEGRVYFHISDEPSAEHLETYKSKKELVKSLIGEFGILDALSDFSFYEQGVVEEPVCASNHIAPFLERRKGKIWSYYCISQAVDVANRFIAMPSARNRIYGYQVFKFEMEGILHWGYNFYNTERSRKHINPYQTVDGEASFPAGDAFLVYPGKDGSPKDSLRMMVMEEAMEDVRAFQLLESLTDHETVLRLVEEGLEEEITFSQYPKGESFCLELRRKVNEKIAELLS